MLMWLRPPRSWSTLAAYGAASLMPSSTGGGKDGAASGGGCRGTCGSPCRGGGAGGAGRCGGSARFTGAGLGAAAAAAAAGCSSAAGACCRGGRRQHRICARMLQTVHAHAHGMEMASA